MTDRPIDCGSVAKDDVELLRRECHEASKRRGGQWVTLPLHRARRLLRAMECRSVFSRLDAPTLDEAAEHFAASDYPPDNTMAVELRRIAGKIRSMEQESKDGA